MAQWGKVDQEDNAPKYVVDATTGETGIDQYGDEVFAIDKTEAGILKGVSAPGWVRRVALTGANAGRYQYETLVATKNISGNMDQIPSNIVAPAITGTLEEGETLTVSNGTWIGYPSPTFTRKWQISANGTSGWADIVGATNATYVLQSGDATKFVRAVVTATNSEGATPVNSNVVGPIVA